MLNKILYKNQARNLPRKVWFSGSEELVRGQGLCYDLDYLTTEAGQTATDPFGARGNIVALPDNTNNLAFAGVTTQSYPAVSGGQIIEIHEPGSICRIAAGINTVLNSTRLTCIAGSGQPGRFGTAGFGGRGSAIALQTKADVQLAGESDITGVVDATGLTITAGSAIFSDVQTGDKVVIYGGTETANNSVVAGIYEVASATDTVITLTSSCVDGDTDAVACSYYVMRGNPTVLAYLFDGAESGLTEYLSVRTGANNSLASGGFTFVEGGAIITADGTGALGDGLFLGQKKGIKVTSALTGNNLVLTPATDGIQRRVVDTDGVSPDGNPIPFDLLTFNDADEEIIVEWMNQWRILYAAGVTVDNS